MGEGQNIFWDSYGLNSPESGIFNHAKSLHQELATLGVTPRIVIPDGPIFSSENFPVAPFPVSKLYAPLLTSKIFYSSLVYSSFSRRLKDFQRENSFVFHGLSNINLPIFSKKSAKCSFVITVHDIIPLLEPFSVSKLYCLQFKSLFSKILKLADCVICVSQWTKESILEYAHVKEKNIVVIQNGFTLKERPSFFLEDPEARKRTINLLFVSRFEKYKNFELLLAILNKGKEKFHLTVVTNNIGISYLRKRIKEKNISNITLLCSLTKKELENVYQKTDVYLHTSKYEGFCLPAAEALSHYKPVVYLRGSGIDEVVGSVGLGLPLLASLDDWVSAIEESYCRRLTSLFVDETELFLRTKNSWHDVAIETKQVYENLT